MTGFGIKNLDSHFKILILIFIGIIINVKLNSYIQ